MVLCRPLSDSELRLLMAAYLDGEGEFLRTETDSLSQNWFGDGVGRYAY